MGQGVHSYVEGIGAHRHSREGRVIIRIKSIDAPSRTARATIMVFGNRFHTIESEIANIFVGMLLGELISPACTTECK